MELEAVSEDVCISVVHHNDARDLQNASLLGGRGGLTVTAGISAWFERTKELVTVIGNVFYAQQRGGCPFQLAFSLLLRPMQCKH